MHSVLFRLGMEAKKAIRISFLFFLFVVLGLAMFWRPKLWKKRELMKSQVISVANYQDAYFLQTFSSLRGAGVYKDADCFVIGKDESKDGWEVDGFNIWFLSGYTACLYTGNGAEPCQENEITSQHEELNMCRRVSGDRWWFLVLYKKRMDWMGVYEMSVAWSTSSSYMYQYYDNISI